MYTNYLFQEASLNNCKGIYFPGEIVELPHVFAVTFSFLKNLSVICLEAKFLQCLFHLLFKSNFLKALLHYLWTFTSSVSHDQICRIFSITSLIRKKKLKWKIWLFKTFWRLLVFPKEFRLESLMPEGRVWFLHLQSEKTRKNLFIKGCELEERKKPTHKGHGAKPQ